MKERREKRRRQEDLRRAEQKLEWETPMYRLAVTQLDRTAERMHLDPNIWQRLRTPQRAHVVSFPFRRDDYDTVETVFGYRVQHLLTMGPTKGASATTKTWISERSPRSPCGCRGSARS